MRRISAYGPPALVLVACLATMLLTPTLLREIGHGRTRAEISLARHTLETDDILERIDRAVTAIAETVGPSVVHIDVRGGGIPDDHPPVGRSSGSGWVYNRDGHIVTNAHVVRGARGMNIQFSDGRMVDGELVGIDPFTDIAVIRAEASSGLFPAARDSDHIPRQGERVFAFGSPFGFKFSMSEGIISGLARDPMSSSQFGGFTNFIQTDAAVNPGNSGGPLVNIHGRVIGMNVAIATARDRGSDLDESGGDSAGISFAIPLQTIETVVDQLIQSGRISRGYLGVRMGEPIGFTNEQGEYQRGIPVDVEPEEPSDQAGLRDDDVITRIGRQEVPNFAIFRSVVGTIPAGERVEVELYRDGERMTREVVLGELPDYVLGQRAAGSITFQLGMQVGRVDDGAVVARVYESSPAARAGFESGQRILSIGGEPVRSPGDVFTLFTASGLLAAKPVEVRVRNELDEGSDEKTIEVQLGR
jgi:serine protease Do